MPDTGLSMDWGDCVQEGVATLACVPIIFRNVITWALIVAGILALFYLIYGGIRYIRSGGDQEKVKGARETLTYALIGLIIIVLSFGIINFIAAITGATCITQFGFGNCK